MMSDQADWAKTKSSEIENVDDPEKGADGSIAQTVVPVDVQKQIRRQVSTLFAPDAYFIDVLF